MSIADQCVILYEWSLSVAARRTTVYSQSDIFLMNQYKYCCAWFLCIGPGHEYSLVQPQRSMQYPNRGYYWMS